MENLSATSPDLEIDRIVAQHLELKVRHATALAKLMSERADLRGTYAFADIVDDSLRWSA